MQGPAGPGPLKECIGETRSPRLRQTTALSPGSIGWPRQLPDQRNHGGPLPQYVAPGRVAGSCGSARSASVETHSNGCRTTDTESSSPGRRTSTERPHTELAVLGWRARGYRPRSTLLPKSRDTGLEPFKQFGEVLSGQMAGMCL